MEGGRDGWLRTHWTHASITYFRTDRGVVPALASITKFTLAYVTNVATVTSQRSWEVTDTDRGEKERERERNGKEKWREERGKRHRENVKNTPLSK